MTRNTNGDEIKETEIFRRLQTKETRGKGKLEHSLLLFELVPLTLASMLVSI